MKFVFLLTILLFFRAEAADLSPKNIEKHFNKKNENCFIFKEVGAKKVYVFNKGLCEKRQTPYSTYKIPHSLIALEVGALEGDKTIIKWDGKKKFLKSWEKDHNLRTAIGHSVVPFYREVAKRIGNKRMSKYLTLMKYGNQKIGDKIDHFWLDGSLKISALEQLSFLESLYLEKLPFDKKHQKFVKEIINLNKNWKGYNLSGKTGSAYSAGDFRFGWFVGHLEKNNKQYIFVISSRGKGAAGHKLLPKAELIFKEMQL